MKITCSVEAEQRDKGVPTKAGLLTQRHEGQSGFMPELRKEENRDPLLSVWGVKGGAVPAGFLLLRHRSPAH